MHEILKKLFASGFSFGLIVPMLAILLATTSPVVASGDDCSVPLDVGSVSYTHLRAHET